MLGTEFRGTFCFAQKWAHWAKNSGVFFEKKILYFFLEMKNETLSFIYHCKSHICQKLFLKLCVKMLLANQIEGLFKV